MYCVHLSQVVCMHIYTYIYVCIYVYTRKYVLCASFTLKLLQPIQPLVTFSKIHTYVPTHTYLPSYMHTYVYTCIHTYSKVCIYVFLFVFFCSCLFVRVFLFVSFCMPVCMHTYFMYICIYKYMYIQYLCTHAYMYIYVHVNMYGVYLSQVQPYFTSGDTFKSYFKSSNWKLVRLVPLEQKRAGLFWQKRPTSFDDKIYELRDLRASETKISPEVG